jgi:ubiquinone/menaquinone biosynthesis C-methylase UbiE
VNLRLSGEIERRLRIENDRPLWHRFHKAVEASLQSLPPGSVFVDLGGGQSCQYAASVPGREGVRVVAVDISAEELAHNRDVDETIVADVSRGLPFGDAEVDLLVSRTLLEHVDGVPAAVEHIARVLKPGGRTIHFMPGRNALFAVAARLLPFGLLLKLLHFARPDTVGRVEFDVHYDHTEPAAIERLFRGAGFRHVTVEWTAAQADYFKPFLPAYLLISRISDWSGTSDCAGSPPTCSSRLSASVAGSGPRASVRKPGAFRARWPPSYTELRARAPRGEAAAPGRVRRSAA